MGTLALIALHQGEKGPHAPFCDVCRCVGNELQIRKDSRNTREASHEIYCLIFARLAFFLVVESPELSPLPSHFFAVRTWLKIESELCVTGIVG